MAGENKHTSVLVVDDDQVHRYMLCSMLTDWGYRTIEADDGTTAVTAVENHSYDAVLMDIRMARMDGHEAFLRIQAIAPALPVILMTAYSTVESAVETIQHHLLLMIMGKIQINSWFFI